MDSAFSVGTILLIGGPMDGVVATQDAPCLRPDWYTYWPPTISRKNAPGQYAISKDGTEAVWLPLHDTIPAAHT